MKTMVTAFAILGVSLLLTGCDDTTDVVNTGDSSESSALESITGAWRTGHAVYTIADDVVQFDHEDKESGVVEYTFIGKITSAAYEADSTIRIVAYVDSCVSTASWTSTFEPGYIALFARNVITGTNVDISRKGTPAAEDPNGYYDPVMASASIADTVSVFATDYRGWKTYDPEM